MLHFLPNRPTEIKSADDVADGCYECDGLGKCADRAHELTCVLIVDAQYSEQVLAFAASIPGAKYYTISPTTASDNFVQNDQLSERLEQVLRMIGQGMSNKVIGRRLGISHFTVRNHVSRLLRIYGVSNREELVALIDTRGIP